MIAANRTPASVSKQAAEYVGRIKVEKNGHRTYLAYLLARDGRQIDVGTFQVEAEAVTACNRKLAELTPARPAVPMMTEAELLHRLARGAGLVVTLEVQTAPKLKAGCPFAGVQKRSVIVATVGGDDQPRTWGQKIDRTPLVIHGGKLYVNITPSDFLRVEYLDSDGREISAREIRPFLPARTGEMPATLTYCMGSVQAITLNGQRYEIERTGTVLA